MNIRLVVLLLLLHIPSIILGQQIFDSVVLQFNDIPIVGRTGMKGPLSNWESSYSARVKRTVVIAKPTVEHLNDTIRLREKTWQGIDLKLDTVTNRIVFLNYYYIDGNPYSDGVGRTYQLKNIVLFKDNQGAISTNNKATPEQITLFDEIENSKVSGGHTSYKVTELGTSFSDSSFFSVFFYGTIPLEVARQNDLPSLILHPNPANRYVSVAGISDSQPYSLFDNAGRKLFSGVHKGEMIDVSHLSQGMYYFCFKSGSTAPLLISR